MIQDRWIIYPQGVFVNLDRRPAWPPSGPYPWRFGPGDVAQAVVAHHDAVGGVQMVLLLQQVKKATVGLFAVPVGGEVHRLERMVQAQSLHLVGGEDPLGVGEQVEMTAFGPQHLQHL